MRKLLLLALALVLAMAVDAKKKNENPEAKAKTEQTSKKTKKNEKSTKKSSKKSKKSSKKNAAAQTPAQPAPPKATPGLFGVAKQQNDYYFDIPDSLIGREILCTVRFTSTPAETRNYGGELLSQRTLYWEVAPSNDKLFLRTNLLVNYADTLDQISRAVVACNSNPIVAALKVESHTAGAYRVKVSDMLLAESPTFGFPSGLKSQWGLQNVNREASYIERISTYPTNTEVRVVRTYSSSSNGTLSGRATGMATIGLNVSFVLLPKEKMVRRLFDPRVGFFADDYNLFSDDQQRVESRRFAVRWRLEPKDSADAARQAAGELIEPRKPIVYYIDPATPKQWRPYLIQGVNDWQEAFEQAGWKNAIRAEEWPENDPSMSMEDARYSVIRYLASDIPNAYGPNVHDPRTGEILESHICWYHNVMTLVHDWYYIQAGSIDEAARKMKYDEDLMGQLIRFVSSHEVGHTLGLRHNFGSSSTVPVDSLRSAAFVEQHGHTPSIMDYARFNYVAQPEDGVTRRGIFPRIGDYDRWAIQWGYTFAPEAYDESSDFRAIQHLFEENCVEPGTRLWWGDGEGRSGDPRCQTEDLGDDAMKASTYGILNLKRLLTTLRADTYERMDVNDENESRLYEQIRQQYLRYVGHVMKNIGLAYYDFRSNDDDAPRAHTIPLEKQRRALTWIDENVFEEPTWLSQSAAAQRYMTQSDPWVRQLATSLVTGLTEKAFLAGMRAPYEAKDFLPELSVCIFRHQGTPYAEAVQMQYVQSLIKGFQTDTTPLRAVLLDELRRIRSQQGARGTSISRAIADLIDRALVIK